MNGTFLVLRFSMAVVTGSVCGPTIQYVRRYRECLWTYGSVCPSLKGVCVDLRFNMPVFTGSVCGYGSVRPSLHGVFVDLGFSMSVPTGSVCGPTVQYVCRHKTCSWSYGSVFASLQGALLVIRIRMPSVKEKDLDWSYSSRLPSLHGISRS